MKVIGLTGGIGSGKSTVSRFLAELGAVVLEADKIGHEAFTPGSGVFRQVVKEFGKGILTHAGEIDRARLGKLVFNNPDALARLNGITHPAIYAMLDDRVDEYRRQGVKVVVLEIPLLLETGRADQADEIWVTVAPEAAVIKRLRERSGLSEEEIRRRIRSQLTNEERIKRADVVIDTDCSLEELKQKVTQLWHKLNLENPDRKV